MKDLEKEINSASYAYVSSFKIDESSSKIGEAFRRGAKSPEAKAFHQQGMYSEEEVLSLLFNCIKFISKDEKSEIWMRLNYKSWFNQNKKK